MAYVRGWAVGPVVPGNAVPNGVFMPHMAEKDVRAGAHAPARALTGL